MHLHVFGPIVVIHKHFTLLNVSRREQHEACLTIQAEPQALNVYFSHGCLICVVYTRDKLGYVTMLVRVNIERGSRVTSFK